jgi:hypothetical protein
MYDKIRQQWSIADYDKAIKPLQEKADSKAASNNDLSNLETFKKEREGLQKRLDRDKSDLSTKP